MKTAIIVSKVDLAGLNIADCLKEHNLQEYNAELHLVEKESIYNENLDKEIQADLFIFATKHQSAKKVHSLSCHSPGNWDKAEAGGEDRKLCVAPAVLLKEAFLELNRLGKELDYEITVEQTHHGPILNKPCMFIEIGSDEEQWKNKKAGEIIAKTIVNILKKPIQKYRIAVLLGGGHYNQMANKIMLRTDIAIGHICAKHNLEYLNENMLTQAVNRTLEEVDLIILDWKGLGQYKQKVVDLLDKLNLNYERAQRILK